MRKKKYFSFENMLIFIVFTMTFLAFIYSIACCLSQPGMMQNLYAHADTMQIPYFAHNLIYDQGHFYDWSLSNAPFLFPDIFVIFLLSLIFKNMLMNFLLYALFQLIFIVLVITGIFYTITKDKKESRLGVLSGLTFLLIFIITTHAHQIFKGYFIGLVISNYHFGSFLMVFASIWMFLALLKKTNYGLALFFSLIIILSSVSDPLFQFYFTVPAAITLTIQYFFGRIDRKRYFHYAILLLVCASFSYLIYRYAPLPFVRSNAFIGFELKDVVNYSHMLAKDFIFENAISSFLWAIFLIWSPISISLNFLRTNEKLSLIDFIILFELITILWTILGFLLLHQSSNHYHVRYLQPFIYGPIYLGLPALLYKHSKLIHWLKNKFVYLFVLFVLFSFALINNPPLILKNLTTYYPEYLACLDKQAKSLHLHAGISDYWEAKPFTAFNHSGVRVAAVMHENFIPHYWNNTLQIYRKNDFDFAVIDNHPVKPSDTLSKSRLIQRFGQPTSRFSCGRYTFYVYKNNKMKNLFTAELINRYQYPIPSLQHYLKKMASLSEKQGEHSHS